MRAVVDRVCKAIIVRPIYGLLTRRPAGLQGRLKRPVAQIGALDDRKLVRRVQSSPHETRYDEPSEATTSANMLDSTRVGRGLLARCGLWSANSCRPDP